MNPLVYVSYFGLVAVILRYMGNSYEFFSWFWLREFYSLHTRLA